MIKIVTVSKLATIVLLAALLSIIFVELCSEHFTQVAESYPQGSTSFTLSHVAEDKQDQTYSSFTNYIDEHDLFLVRVDQLSERDGGIGTKLGVYGSIDAANGSLDFNFMGQNVFDANKLIRLVTSPSNSSTLGLSISNTTMLEDLPSFALGNKLVVEKLSYLKEESGTTNGTYRVLGLATGQENELVTLLASTSGNNADEILHPHSGHATISIITLVLPPIAFAAAIFLFALFIISYLFELKTLGTCITCGWTKSEFTFSRLYIWLLFSLLSLPLALAIGVGITYKTILSWEFFLFMGGAALLTILITAFCAIGAALVVFRVRPADAIRNRISRRILVVILLCAYVGTTAFVDFCGYMLDSPLQQMQTNAEIARQWDAVSNLNILEKISRGQDSASFTGQSDKLSQKFYAWYSSIADDDGVYLAHTAFATQEGLDELRLRNPPCEVPDNSFLQYAASPNYLESQNFSIDPALTAAAHAGVRVYFLPDTLSQDEQRKMESYLRYYSEGSNKNSFGIKTAFDANPRFSFSTYTPKTNFFCWDQDISHPQTQNDPVIFLCVPENMIFAEDLSLWAIGLSNSYIKLSDEAVSAYTSSEYLSKFDLDGNEPHFISTAAFVAGLQKTLGQTIGLFGSVALLAVVLMLAMVLGLTAAYQIAYREEVAAKRLMGYSVWSVYQLPFMVVGITFVLGELVVLYLRSSFGIALMALLLALQIVVLLSYVKTSQAQQINRELKE